MISSASSSRLASRIARAVLPGTPSAVIEAYQSLPDRARTRTFGLIEQDVVVLDTETTGLSRQDDELIEISAAVLSGREVTERFETFVRPSKPIPAEIVELTGIRDADVRDAPPATQAVRDLARFVGGRPVIAHNAAFDRAFIEAVPGGSDASDIWIDSLALSRIALPRLASHRLSSLAETFGCADVSHRAGDDVRALCGVWRILLCALADLPAGLLRRLADMHPDVAWSYRPIFSHIASENPGEHFSLAQSRSDVLRDDASRDHVDADELPALDLPARSEIASMFCPGSLVDRMYPSFEPRPEQTEMALSVRDALETSTHRVIEAGTGVGKSIAYLIPAAEAAKRNRITIGVATKSNNLADQLMFHELPKLAAELDGGLSFCALKGSDHYPCLRKLEAMSRGSAEIKTRRDPADTLTAVAVIYAHVCQAPAGDLDSLGIRWRSVSRSDLTCASRECARRLCPFFPDKCLVHGARRRAARADIVVTNHSLLFRNVAAEGKILPPIRHWVIDEAHSIEGEARRQWAVSVSADETRSVFERLGDERVGVLGRLIRDAASSEAATLHMGLAAKAAAHVCRAGAAMAEMFDAVRDAASSSRTGGFDRSVLWIGPELRASDAWKRLDRFGRAARDAVRDAARDLVALTEATADETGEGLIEVADGARRLKDLAAAIDLIVCGQDDRFVYSIRINRRSKAGGEELVAERIDIGEALAEQWLPEVHTAIFTSATISVSGSFKHFDHQVGLDRLGADAHRDLHLESSYDFDENMAVVVAADMPDPRDRDAYIDALENILCDVHMAMGGSTLTLFTNRRDMETLFERVEPRLARAGLELGCQLRGAPGKQLRDRFVQKTESSLFALKAFWEGFDASGETLRCVVIPKLPFTSPTDPLSCERSLREDRAWAKYALPDAVLEIKQAAGRLIRSSSDRGVLVLADSRLMTKGYGKKFLHSLPNSSYQRIETAQMGRFLKLWRRSHEHRRG
ncbi:DNA polymerase III, epsilon subunit [Coriobacterium glomerans PW2]|uniref:DNA polymerase III, epsilon subunit n=1 Tax=Coriobacterium glomerans (strain ATCC 49209 / DSM 20642 / JCM 10262 / PW2) TaxID=700015 RepID=F2N9E0_CORGP|nr:helicase C-terminal domain-containing protein [Coriobacterium glomerans]AEB07888.1 DNA polymerase III, epsilon subunit [Coriobacterium glomerans PW2]